MNALAKTVVGNQRLTTTHLHRRDQALAAMAAAMGALDELAESEDDRSPRISDIREIRGDLGQLRVKLDGVYR